MINLLVNFHLRLYDCYIAEEPKWGLLIVVTVLGHLNFGLFVLTLHLCVHSASTVMVIYLHVTKMLFTGFDRVDRLIVANGRHYVTSHYYRFAVTHTRLLLEVFRMNRLISIHYLQMITVNVPFNALAIIAIVMGKIPSNSLIPILLTVVVVISGSGLMHWVCNQYNRRIHRCSRLLFHVSVHRRNHFGANLRAHLHLDHYISKFHLKCNQYGITYGPGFGVIDNRSLGKVGVRTENLKTNLLCLFAR